jgi:hypothetical protein
MMRPLIWEDPNPVRMLVPPVDHRRAMDGLLVEYFRAERPGYFRRAISAFCRFYAIKPPRIEWCEYIDWGRAAGKTFEDGRIHLVHPQNWKRGRIYRSERMWVQTVYHELGHYLFWTDAERKAEAFTYRMVRGIRRPRRNLSGPHDSARRVVGGRARSSKRVVAETRGKRGARLRRAAV